MTRTTLALLMALPPTGATPPRPSADAIPDFGRVGLTTLRDLDGRRLRCTFVPGSLPSNFDDLVVVDAAGAP
jgi:hypothetical protein